MALGMEDGEWLMITDFLGTDGHGFYKKRHGGAARWEWLILHKAILKYRHGSTFPPKYFGFAEVLHARQCSNAFDIALA